ncbi:MAG: bacteriophage Gp15 family protein [Dialister sp.]|nr:bacteriophage Gp15 family protein [Dialister sp.]
MIGFLPETLRINGRDVEINTDFRRVLIVLVAFNDPELTDKEKAYIMLDCLIGVGKLSREDIPDAVKQCNWFIDGGHDYSEDPPKHRKLMDWEQDEQMIFSAVNDVAGKETRAQPYIHWWTFLGYFNEIREGLFSQVLLIRQKKSKGKKLTKEEQDFYRQNKSLVDIKHKLTQKEQEEVDKWNQILPD